MKKIFTFLGLLTSGFCQSLYNNPLDNLVPTYGSDLDSSDSEDQAQYSGQASASAPVMSGVDMLRMAVPGSPGDDYPILAEVPETSFSCDGRVEGGYYADVEAECQPFHICTTDSDGGLSKYSFLCPNGTLFNQAYFVCEYWFNVDCSQSESFYGLNEELGQSALSPSASSPTGGYSAPVPSYARAAPEPASPPSQEYFASSPVAEAEYSAPADYISEGARTGRQQGGRTGRIQGDAKRKQTFGVNQKGNTKVSSKKLPKKVSTFEASRQGRKNVDLSRNPQSRPGANQKGNTVNNIGSKRVDNKGNSRRAGNVRTGRRQNGKGLTPPQDTRSSVRNNGNNRNSKKVNKSFSPKSKTNQRFGKQLTSKRGKGQARKTNNNGRNSGRRGRQEGGSDNSYIAPADSYVPSEDSGALAADSYLPPGDSYSPPSESAADAYLPPVDSYSPPTNALAPTPETSFSDTAAPLPAADSYLPPDNSYSPPQDDTSGSNTLAASAADSYLPPDNSYSPPQENISGSNTLAASAGDSYLPPDNSYVPEEDEISGANTLADYEYEEAPLPTYSRASPTAGQSSYIAGGLSSSYGAPTPDIEYDSSLADADYEEDILPSYNNGVYTAGGGGSYSAPPADDNTGLPLDTGYAAPLAEDSYRGPGVQSDIAPAGDSYGAPARDSYRAPSSDKSYRAPASSQSPVPGGYQDPGADNLPEYYKSEISLGLTDPDDVPEVDPFSFEYGAPADRYSAAASNQVVSAQVPQPDLTYGVPAAPTISLEDYNIPEVSDRGYSGGRGSGYGR